MSSRGSNERRGAKERSAAHHQPSSLPVRRRRGAGGGRRRWGLSSRLGPSLGPRGIPLDFGLFSPRTRSFPFLPSRRLASRHHALPIRDPAHHRCPHVTTPPLRSIGTSPPRPEHQSTTRSPRVYNHNARPTRLGQPARSPTLRIRHQRSGCHAGYHCSAGRTRPCGP